MFLDRNESRYYVVTMTPTFQPIGVSTQNATIYNAPTTSTCCFSGWNARTTAYSAHAYWRVPSISNPPQFNCFFTGIGCILSQWVGIENTAGTLIQGGVDGVDDFEIYSLLWYEFYPSPAVMCSIGVSPGAIVDTYVYQTNGVWYVSTQEEAPGALACSSSLRQTNAGWVAQFYLERPQGCGLFGCFTYHLPQFSVVQMGEIWINGFHPINAYSYDGDTLYNCNAYNIQLGSPTQFDDFTQTWLTSACA